MTRMATIIFFWLLMASGAFADEKPLTFAVVPQQSATKLAMLWGPLLKEVSLRSGIALRFRTAPDIPEFETRLGLGKYDFAYMNPYHYAFYHQTAGYRAFAKAKDRLIQGIIVVHKDSPYQELSELDGKTLVFPSPAAFAASILTQALLSSEGVAISSLYVASHDSVYRAVASGRYVAGGGIQRTLEAMDEKTRSKLRILKATDRYTPHAFAAHPAIGDETVGKIRKAFMSLADDEIGRALLAPLRLKGIVAAEDADWNDVRRLKLDRLQSPAVSPSP